MKTSRLVVALIAVACAFAQAARAADATPTAPKIPRHEEAFRNLSVTAPKLAKAPTIDGTVDADEWGGAGIAPRMIPWERGDLLTDGQGRFYLGYTDDALYLAWQIQRPKIAIAPKATITRPDTGFFRTDDALEFFVSCGPESKHRKVGWDYNFAWNALGTKYDRRSIFGATQVADLPWTGPWKAVSRTVDDFGWEGEAIFPLSLLEGNEKPGPGAYWIFQLCGNFATPEANVNLLGYQINWFTAVDYPTLLFTGSEGVVARVLDCGAMADTGRSGLILELLNPGKAPRTVVPKMMMYKRIANASSSQEYLRAFDQARDRSDTIAGTGARSALFLPDTKVSADFIAENYEKVKEQSDPVTLAAGAREKIDFTIGKDPGNYLIIYEVRYAEGQESGEHRMIAGAPLPYEVPEPLAVSTRNFLLIAHEIAVKADLRYVPDWQSKGTISAKLVDKASNDVKFEKQWPGDGLYSEVTFSMPTKDLAAGDYTLHLSVADASGKELSKRATPINVPTSPEWFRKPVGEAPLIPPPWRPIEVADAGKKLSFLMGEIDVAESVLPTGIRVETIYSNERKPILRAPVTLTGVVDGQNVEWKSSAAKLEEKRDDLVRVTSSASAGNITIDATGEFEYDGMEKVTLKIAPAHGAKPNVTGLTLSIPLTKECSDLYQSVVRILGEDKVKIKNGSIPPDGHVHDWRPMVWVGNSRQGIEFFTENWRGWRWGKDSESKLIEVRNSPEGATLVVHFVAMDPAKPLVLDKPREIQFGLMFTPARSINRKPIRHGLNYFAIDIPKHQPHMLEADIAAGVNVVEVWNHYDKQGWPDQTPERSAQLKGYDDRLEKYGVKVTPYSGWFIHRKAEVYPVWGAEMLSQPITDAGCGCDAVCWNSTITDAWLWTYMNAAKASGYDGYRLDAGFSVSACNSMKHSYEGSKICGWIDDNGNLQSSLAIFGAREGSKRMYRMFHGGEVMDNGICIIPPTQPCRFSAILSHMDAGISAEGAERTARNMKEFDLSYWRASLMEDRRGLPLIYWPKTETLGRDSRYGVGQLHRLTPRGGSFISQKEQSYSRVASPIASIWKAEDWVGWLAEGTEFYGYWENKQLLDTGNLEVYGTFHVRRGEKLLLNMLNRERAPVETTVKVDFKSLGFDGPIYAYDAVLNEPIEVKDGNAITLTFTGEGFRMVKFAAEPFKHIAPKKIGENLIPELAADKWPAEGLPAGWKLEEATGGFSIVDGAICATGKADSKIEMRRNISLVPGKHYVLEADISLACNDGVFMGPHGEQHAFGIVFGGSYFPLRTLGSQLLPGRSEKFQIYYSPKNEQEMTGVTRIYLNGNGKAFVRNIGVYEVDQHKPPYEPTRPPITVQASR